LRPKAALRITTWDLPDVRGPQWVPSLAPADSLRRGELTLNTPWHFSLLAADGLGSILESEHRDQMAERGVDDEGAWETYARMLEVYYWETVLRKRYGSERLTRGFVTKMESVMGQTLDLSQDRVQWLRKRLRALQSDSLKSPHGRR